MRCWVLPGNQHDSQRGDQVHKDLIGLNLGRVVGVMNRGIISEENQRILQRGCGRYIPWEKLGGNLHIQEDFTGDRPAQLCDCLQSPASFAWPHQPAADPRTVVLRAESPQSQEQDQGQTRARAARSIFI